MTPPLLDAHAISLLRFIGCVTRFVEMAFGGGDSPTRTVLPGSNGTSTPSPCIDDDALSWSAYSSTLLKRVSFEIVQSTLGRAVATDSTPSKRKRRNTSTGLPSTTPRPGNRRGATTAAPQPVEACVFVSVSIVPVGGCGGGGGGSPVMMDVEKIAESLDCRYVPRLDTCVYVAVPQSRCTVAVHPRGALVARQDDSDQSAALFALDCVKTALEQRVANCGMVLPSEGIAYSKGPVAVNRRFRYDFESELDLDAIRDALLDDASLIWKRWTPGRELDVRCSRTRVTCNVREKHIICTGASRAVATAFFEAHIWRLI